MTDTPGHPGEVPVQRTLGDGTQPDNHSSIPERDPLEMALPRPSQGLAYGETPLDKPRSFRDDNTGASVGDLSDSRSARR